MDRMKRLALLLAGGNHDRAVMITGPLPSNLSPAAALDVDDWIVDLELARRDPPPTLDEVESLRNDLVVAEQEASGYEDRVLELEVELDDASERITVLEGELEECQGELEEARNRLHDANSHCIELMEMDADA